MNTLVHQQKWDSWVCCSAGTLLNSREHRSCGSYVNGSSLAPPRCGSLEIWNCFVVTAGFKGWTQQIRVSVLTMMRGSFSQSLATRVSWLLYLKCFLIMPIINTVLISSPSLFYQQIFFFFSERICIKKGIYQAAFCSQHWLHRD